MMNLKGFLEYFKTPFLSKLGKQIQGKFESSLIQEEKINDLLIKLKKTEERLILMSENIREEIKIRENEIIAKENALKQIYKEKSIGFPWLSNAIAEFNDYFDADIEEYLRQKNHKAIKSANIVNEIRREKKLLTKELNITKNYIKYYESLFPWLRDYIDEDLDEILLKLRRGKPEEDGDDPVKTIIGDIKYNKLNSVERNQLALDMYIKSRKSNWQIGREYERYIGYLYQKDGYSVEYIGIEKGLEDLGRDLICRKGLEIEIVQCKYWNSNKLIHEKHINQLYGTTVMYKIEESKLTGNKTIFNYSITPKFITSTKLSETAIKFAEALDVKVIQEKPLNEYPRIKCNVNSKEEKIYHLPFDQQYDRTIIRNKGEFFASTVKEAEEMGFRRAFKWKGNN